MKKTFVVALCAGLVLAACSDRNSDNQATSTASAGAVDICANPALPEQIKLQVQNDFNEYAKNIVKNDGHAWIDATKLAELASNLSVETSDAKTVGLSCQAQVRITLAKPVLDVAEANAPLLQIDTPVALINQGIQGSNSRFDGTVLTVLLNYSVQNNNGQFAYTVSDQNLNSAVRTLSEALVAYGVKDMLNINGQTVSREQALAMLKAPKPVAIASAPVMVPTMMDVQPIDNTVPEPPKSEELAGNSLTNGTQAAPEVMLPEQQSASSHIQNSDLEEARKANSQADQSIKSAWRKISPDIQQSLLEEQRNWESKKRQSCRSAGAKGADVAEIQYLQMQCDTRLTRERVQYLNGFSIE